MMGGEKFVHPLARRAGRAGGAGGVARGPLRGERRSDRRPDGGGAVSLHAGGACFKLGGRGRSGMPPLLRTLSRFPAMARLLCSTTPRSAVSPGLPRCRRRRLLFRSPLRRPVVSEEAEELPLGRRLPCRSCRHHPRSPGCAHARKAAQRWQGREGAHIPPQRTSGSCATSAHSSRQRPPGRAPPPRRARPWTGGWARSTRACRRGGTGGRGGGNICCPMLVA